MPAIPVRFLLCALALLGAASAPAAEEIRIAQYCLFADEAAAVSLQAQGTVAFAHRLLTPAG